MKKLVLAVAIVAVGATALIATAIAKNGNGGGRSFSAKLTGFEEIIPAGGAVSTNGNGRFSARVSTDEIRYRLSYQDLEGGNVLFAHIHFGQFHTTGGISAFLCGDTVTNDIPNTCPASGTVEGTIRPTDVVGPAGQGIAPGEFSELIRAMRKGVTYANVHTQTFMAGEIRGQIGHGRHHGHGKGKRN
jgi:CHRD domain